MLSADILGERTRLTPEREALLYVPTGRRYSYGELNQRATRCARLWLDSCRLRPGDRVGILAHNSVEYLDAFFASGKSGVILVLLSTRATPHELEPIVNDSGLRCLMYGGGCPEAVSALRRLPQIENWIALEEAEPGAAGDRRYGEAIAGLPDVPLAVPPPDSEDIYCLLYTSGTTGRPKGVMIPHRQVAWNAYNTVACWQLRDDDVAPIFTPLYHAGGLAVLLAPLVVIGGRVVLHRGFDAAEVWRILAAEQCTVVFGVPTIFKLLMEAPEFAAFDASQVRWFISGGAPLPRYLLDAYQARGIVLKQGYGLTEAGVNCFSMTAEESVRKAGSIGKPMMFSQARLVDAAGKDVAAGEVGELLLRGPHLSRGYWKRPQATAAAFDRDGWLHTGDLARRDEEGFFYIAGRLKEMFISGGVNVYPAEIETELLLHPQVRDAAVIAVSHPTWGEVGVAFVATSPGEAPAAEELAEFLRTRLAGYKVPREFVFRSSLPRTPYGKVLKSELREAYLRAHRESTAP